MRRSCLLIPSTPMAQVGLGDLTKARRARDLESGPELASSGSTGACYVSPPSRPGTFKQLVYVGQASYEFGLLYPRLASLRVDDGQWP